MYQVNLFILENEMFNTFFFQIGSFLQFNKYIILIKIEILIFHSF